MSARRSSIRAVVFDCYGVLDLDRLNSDMIPILDQLAGHYRLGVLSNSDRDSLEDFLDRHHIRGRFDVVLASGQTRYRKPQREIFEIMAERLDLNFHEILFIDDSPLNTTAAERYGMSVITYHGSGQLEHELEALSLI